MEQIASAHLSSHLCITALHDPLVLLQLQYKVLEAKSSTALVARNATVIRWCGWEHIVKDPRVCHFSLSPLQDHHLAVDPDDASSLFDIGKDVDGILSCKLLHATCMGLSNTQPATLTAHSSGGTGLHQAIV
jgi:hypothetical protein